MTNETVEIKNERTKGLTPSRWAGAGGAGVLRENGSWIVFGLYGVFTLGVILLGLTYTEYVLELWACLLAPFVIGMMIPVVRSRMVLLLLGAVCLVIVLTMGEALFRLRHFGSEALTHPLEYGPGTTTTLRGMIRVSDDPVRGFELSSGFDGLWNGKTYAINDWGYRDREFVTARTPGTMRVVVLGDSFTMASGVEVEQGVSRVLEQRLNEMGIRAEVYNLSVSGYDLPQIARVLETDAVKLRPDVVILAQYTWVTGQRWSNEEVDWQSVVSEAQTTRDRQHIVHYFSFLRGLTPRWTTIENRLKGLARKVGLASNDAKAKQPLALPMFLDQLAAAGRAHGFRPAVLLLRPLEFRPSFEPVMAADRDRVQGWCTTKNVLFLDTFNVFPENAFPNSYIIYPGNSHPNAPAHALYAEAAAEQLRDAGALPAPAPDVR